MMLYLNYLKKQIRINLILRIDRNQDEESSLRLERDQGTGTIKIKLGVPVFLCKRLKIEKTEIKNLYTKENMKKILHSTLVANT